MSHMQGAGKGRKFVRETVGRPYSEIFPALRFPHPFAHFFKSLCSLIQQLFDPIPYGLAIPFRSKQTQLLFQTRCVAGECKELLRELLKKAIELRVIGVVGSVDWLRL